MKILAIDDSKIALMQIERCVHTGIPGTEVVKIQNPEEGIEIAKKLHGDLGFIFVDYNMEVMNGIEVIDEILKFFSPKRIALMTANTQSAIRSEAEKRGIHFLSKELLKDDVNLILKDLAP
jgi:two-component system chemotaxis response regulator CheY